VILKVCDSEPLQVQARSRLHLQTAVSIFVLQKWSRPHGGCEVCRVGRCRNISDFQTCHELHFM